MLVRVAEALREPVSNGHVHSIRWDEGRYVRDAWPLELCDTADPRKFLVHGGSWQVMALTSLSWLLPVELTPDGLDVVAAHYDRARSEEHTSELQSLMRISYAVFCLKKKKQKSNKNT